MKMNGKFFDLFYFLFVFGPTGCIFPEWCALNGKIVYCISNMSHKIQYLKFKYNFYCGLKYCQNR